MLNEVAPPSKKHERMVKHIKKSYAKKGGLSDEEKSIAYATAWKNYKKNESVGFTIDTPEHNKAKKKQKARNLAKGNENPNEKKTAERMAGGPKLVGEAEMSSMQDNNLFGNAYAGSYKQLKKKIGSKKKHTKPAVEEGVDASYSQGQVTYSSFYNRAKEARKAMATKAAKKIEYDKKNDAVRADYKKHGIKFSDKKGTGRIVKGKKRYD